MIHLDYRDARPIYTQITDGFRNQILSGLLRPGEKLPSVRDLAVQLTINPNTIQRAYRELEIQGWISAVPGKGCFVCGVPALVDAEQESAWENFHKAAGRLLALGITREELIARLNQGGNDYA